MVEGFRVFNGGKPSRPGGEGLSEDRLEELGIEGF